MNVSTVIQTTEPTISGHGLAETGKTNEIKKIAQEQSQVQELKKAQKDKPEMAELKELAATLNEYMDDLQTNLGFSIHEGPNRQVIVEIKNRKTDELIKQIPSEELVAIREKMAELTGLLLDKSA
ncbi:MAG: hypothetical protein DRH26_16665 [Deltaproteobacteria bacterium]|nr:MAG: hypothetical protein DRH26_16665 [Deltaproteobacteria bacterium]